MLSGLFIENKSALRNIAILGLIMVFALNLVDYSSASAGTQVYFNGMLRSDTFSMLFNAIAIGATLIYFLLSGSDIAAVGKFTGEYFALIFFILAGTFLAASFNNLLMLFLAIEILSIPQYILAGSDKKNLKSNEASLKYFLMGAFSTGFLLLGITLLYGATGTFFIEQMNLSGMGANPIALTGVLLIAFALAFKVSAAPFHFWTPDVYDGMPTVFTSFISTIVKAAGFIAFIRLFHISFATPNLSATWKVTLEIITAVTLVIGNLTAVFQQSVKRMLAYSSISQAGFMLFAVISVNATAWQGILMYAAAYSIATIGCFAVLLKMKDYTYDGFIGLAKSHPWMALANTVFLFSLVGIPATGGFLAKYFVLTAAVQQGGQMWLVILAVCCAAVSAFYYFRVVWAMYFRQGDANQERTVPTSSAFKVLLSLTALIVILIGIFPDLILHWL